jgi:uncharacterized protein DUF6916
MVVSRRGFMKRGSLLVLAAGVSLSSADRIFGRDTDLGYPGSTQDDLPPKGNKPAPFNFTKATFAPYVDTVFRIYPDSSKAVKTILVSVGDIGPVPDKKRDGRECFVLRFRGTETLRQNTYEIEHELLGRFKLFLVPAGKNKKSVYYQAVINRLNA